MSGRHRKQRIAVLGADSAMGAAIAARLATTLGGAAQAEAAEAPSDAAATAGAEVLCVGPRRIAVDGASWRIIDLRDPALARKLAGVDAVVVAHLDPNIDGATPPGSGPGISEAVVSAIEAAGVTRVVLLSSAMVLGALPDNPVPLPDDAPRRAELTEGMVADLKHAEEVFEQWSERSGGALSIVRRALLVGPGIDTALTRFFEAPRFLVVGESEPLWQFTHIDDLASAVAFCLQHHVVGPVSAVCHGWWEQEQLLARTGMRQLRLPAQVAISTADRLHRIGVSPSSSAELDYLRYPWVVSGERLRAAGWSPHRTTGDVVAELLERASERTAIVGRRVGRPDAASLGAAGAAAAVLGAAALIRARRRRDGL
jgi:nucleoside-diphosphate-sugar epimerase